MWVFVVGDFSANGNRSPHGLFKDLDLSRTFHYSECCVEKCLCRSQGPSPTGCTQQDFTTRAQCSVRKWRIYTCWSRSAVLPAILREFLSTFLKLWSLWSPKVRPVSYPNLLLSRPIYIFLSLSSLCYPLGYLCMSFHLHWANWPRQFRKPLLRLHL